MISEEKDQGEREEDVFSFVLQEEIRKSFTAEIRLEQRAEKVIHSENKSLCKGMEGLNSTA